MNQNDWGGAWAWAGIDLSKCLQSATGLENHCCDKGSFTHSSSGKESACNAGDLSSIPGLGRSAGEGTGYPLQYPWASLGKECACITGDLGSIPGLGKPLEKGKATHSSILAWRIPWTEDPGRPQSTVLGSQSVGTQLKQLSMHSCKMQFNRHAPFRRLMAMRNVKAHL